ncbi:hypothetical protein C8Q78DRAFT_337268 [Trametes maxima]|nr:hypothetical protein C8Q78DRAFT_337268 [Trametes maxima]
MIWPSNVQSATGLVTLFPFCNTLSHSVTLFLSAYPRALNETSQPICYYSRSPRIQHLLRPLHGLHGLPPVISMCLAYGTLI